MGRKKKYNESTTATSEAQKAAAREYYKRNKDKNKTISITQSAVQAATDKATLKKHGLTPLTAWRRLMSELNAEPIPANNDENKPE